jgi:leucyl aminopeptidase
VEFSIKSGSPEKQRSACVVVGVFESRKPTLAADLLDRISDGYISDILRRGDMEGKLGSTVILDRKSTRLNSSHNSESRMPSSA